MGWLVVKEVEKFFKDFWIMCLVFFVKGIYYFDDVMDEGLICYI